MNGEPMHVKCTSSLLRSQKIEAIKGESRASRSFESHYLFHLEVHTAGIAICNDHLINYTHDFQSVPMVCIYHKEKLATFLGQV